MRYGLVARGKPLAFARPDLLALAGDRFHAFVQRIGIEQRHGDRQDCRDDGDSDGEGDTETEDGGGESAVQTAEHPSVQYEDVDDSQG